MQIWVDRFREWMAAEVLKKLLVATDKAHIVSCASTAFHTNSMHCVVCESKLDIVCVSNGRAICYCKYHVSAADLSSVHDTCCHCAQLTSRRVIMPRHHALSSFLVIMPSHHYPSVPDMLLIKATRKLCLVALKSSDLPRMQCCIRSSFHAHSYTA